MNLRAFGLLLGLIMALGLVPHAEAGSAQRSKAKPVAGHSARAKPQRAVKPKRAVKPQPAARSRRSADRVAAERRAKRAPARAAASALVAAPVLSQGQQMGLHEAGDPLDLKSAVALVVDEETNEVLLSKNSEAVLPIASITKLMTALVVVEAGQALDEELTIAQEDVDTEKHSRSRLAVGAVLTRGEMLHLALMSSENRAAHALGRHFPGGIQALVAAMNFRAASLGMTDTLYVEPTGLSSRNRSSAHDLAALVREAHRDPLMREFSTSQEAQLAIGERILQFRNTNGLVRNPSWEIGLQKTGYISEAGRCLVMQARLAGRKLIMVLLDSAGRYSRLGDAERIRRWLDEAGGSPAPVHAAVRRAL